MSHSRELTKQTRKTIVEALVDIGCPAYFGQADETAQMPYIIYDVQIITHMDNVPVCELEFNVVGYGRDTLPVETLCDTLEEMFDHQTFSSNGVFFEPYFERKNRVETEDRQIIRRRMVFNFNLYET